MIDGDRSWLVCVRNLSENCCSSDHIDHLIDDDRWLSLDLPLLLLNNAKEPVALAIKSPRYAFSQRALQIYLSSEFYHCSQHSTWNYSSTWINVNSIKCYSESLSSCQSLIIAYCIFRYKFLIPTLGPTGASLFLNFS